MNPVDIAILAVVGVVVATIVGFMVYNKVKGKNSGCGCGCGCASCTNCQSANCPSANSPSANNYNNGENN